MCERYEPLLELIPDKLKRSARAGYDIDKNLSRQAFLESVLAQLPSERHLADDNDG